DGIRDFHVTGVQTCALPIYTDALQRRGSKWLGRICVCSFDHSATTCPTARPIPAPVKVALLILPTTTRTPAVNKVEPGRHSSNQIGRASCRERGKSAVGSGR